MCDAQNGSDLFRLAEKRVKNYARSVAAVKTNMSKRQRLKAEQGRSAEESNFNWNEVIDVSCMSCSSENPYSVNAGSSSSGGGKLFDLSFVSPGLFLVSNALSVEEQIHWASKAVEEYSTAEHNNLNNLSSLYEASSSAADESNSADSQATGTGKEPSAVPSVVDLWKDSVSEEVPFQLFSKLRWSCLGYHYDWTKRMYQKNLKSEFPPDLSALCSSIAKSAGLDLVVEAAIVNYYPAGASMGGHLDDAEHTLEKPIISISLGLSAIFLIGGRDRTVAPTPILVRSGDAVIMSGDSRYCFHGVPLILPADFQPLPSDKDGLNQEKTLRNVGEKESVSMDLREEKPRQYSVSNVDRLAEFVAAHPSCSEDTRAVVRYLQQARINMNVRQVRVLAGSGADDSCWVEKCGSGASTANTATANALG